MRGVTEREFKFEWWLRVITFAVWAAALALFVLAGPAAAAEQKAFAEEKVVLQISDADPFKQTFVLNVANNLVKHYGPDAVE